MPQVPIVQGPQVRSAPLEGGFQRQVDVSSDLQRAGQGLMAVGSAVGMQEYRDATTRAEDSASKLTSAWMKWDSENRKNFRGENANGYEAAAQEWWNSAKQTFGQDLDPLSKKLASATLNRRMETALGNVAQFVGAEKERHKDEVSASAINTSIQFGVTTGDVAGAAQQVRDQVAAMGARKGWTTEQVQAEQLRNLSSLHLAQITKMASLDATKAAEYYQANKSEVAAQNQPRVEEILKGEGDNQAAQQFAAQHADKPLAEQLKLAGEITDPARREKVIREVKLNHAAVREAEAEKERQASDQAWQLVGQGKRVPEAILAQMDGKGRVQLQEHLQARAERLAKGATVKTNPMALAKVYDMMRDDPEGFKKLRMATLTEAFAPNDIEQVARIQRDMLKPDKEKDVATTSQLLGTYVGGWKPEKKAHFEAAAYDELARFEKEKGRPANYEEKKKVFDRLMIDGEVLSGSWWQNDPNKKFYEATPEERKRFAPTITSDDRRLVKAALQAEGVKDPTDEQIVQRFKLAKGIK